MRLADFQNPIANMPLMQQMQQTQHSQVQSAPIVISHQMENRVKEELTTVQESPQQSEKDKINEENLPSEDTRHKSTHKRAKSIESETETVVKKPRLDDGIHGRFLDVEG